MNGPAAAVEQYLARHAEGEARLADVVASHHGHVLGVPVYDEGDSFFRLLSSVAAGPAGSAGSALVIAVVNARDDSPDAVALRNRRLLSRTRDSFPKSERLAPGARLHTTSFGELLCIDRSSSARLPRRQGVGLARKIAGDLALALLAKGKIASRWIHFTDADAQLPPDYFSRLNDEGSANWGWSAGVRSNPEDPRTPAVAAIYPFRHVSSDAALQRAGALHEIFLRHYVVGLHSAGSPYAYHSIGSLVAVAATAYASVRGVPRRHGAEDFYLLNKLAKHGRIACLTGAPIELEVRASDRVPFGTGPSIRKLLDSQGPPPHFHCATSFAYLGALIATVEPTLQRDSPGDANRLLRETGTRRGLVPELLEEMGDFLGLHSLLAESMTRSPRPATRVRDWHTRFDALRTLKLMHWLRDRGLPDTDWRSALSGLPDLDLDLELDLGLDADSDPQAGLEALIALEERLCSGSREFGN